MNEKNNVSFFHGVIDDTVSIPRNEYNDLLEDSMFLACLEDQGVDNWDGYQPALEAFMEELQEVAGEQTNGN